MSARVSKPGASKCTDEEEDDEETESEEEQEDETSETICRMCR